ncbi:hypothetical protein Aduo_003550 [Ancylostoma duodenale]
MQRSSNTTSSCCDVVATLAPTECNAPATPHRAVATSQRHQLRLNATPQQHHAELLQRASDTDPTECNAPATPRRAVATCQRHGSD